MTSGGYKGAMKKCQRKSKEWGRGGEPRSEMDTVEGTPHKKQSASSMWSVGRVLWAEEESRSKTVIENEFTGAHTKECVWQECSQGGSNGEIKESWKIVSKTVACSALWSRAGSKHIGDLEEEAAVEE